MFKCIYESFAKKVSVQLLYFNKLFFFSSEKRIPRNIICTYFQKPIGYSPNNFRGNVHLLEHDSTNAWNFCSIIELSIIVVGAAHLPRLAAIVAQ